MERSINKNPNDAYALYEAIEASYREWSAVTFRHSVYGEVSVDATYSPIRVSYRSREKRAEKGLNHT